VNKLEKANYESTNEDGCQQSKTAVLVAGITQTAFFQQHLNIRELSSRQ